MAHELPPPAQMVLLLGGFRISQALYAAAALGVGFTNVVGVGACDPDRANLCAACRSAGEALLVWWCRLGTPVWLSSARWYRIEAR